MKQRDRRKDEVFHIFQALLEPFSITMFYTDDWGAMSVIFLQYFILLVKHTQSIERKNLTLPTHIKRLCRKTIC